MTTEDQKPSILVDLNYLKAALRIAAKEDIRYYLNGICVHADAAQTTLVATDGHRLIVLRKLFENRLSEEATIIIPRGIVENILRLSSKRITMPLELLQEDGITWSAPLTSASLDSGARLQFRSIEAKFPDWNRVVPESISGEAGNYNAKYLRDFQSAANDIGTFHPALLQNGPTSAGVMVLAPDCLGIIMPMRYEGVSPTDWKRPDWLRADAEQEQEPAGAAA